MMRTTRATIIALPLLIGSPGQGNVLPEEMGQALFQDPKDHQGLEKIGNGWEDLRSDALKKHDHSTTLKQRMMTHSDVQNYVKSTDENSITEEDDDDWSVVSHNNDYLGSIEIQEQQYDIEIGRRIANLAYESNPEAAIGTFDVAHLSDIKAFQAQTGLLYSQTSDCGFVAQDGDKFVVSIRGTVTSYDWGTNFNARKISSPETLGIQGEVHAGFYKYAKSAFGSIWADLDQRLENRKNDWIARQQSLRGNPTELEIQNAYIEILNSADCIVHGHSLGGAAAQILTLMIKKAINDRIDDLIDAGATAEKDFSRGKIGAFTYESPRPFSHKAAAEFDAVIGEENHIRVIQVKKDAYLNTDPVTSVSPGFLGFKHTGTKFIEELSTPEKANEAGPVLHTTVKIDSPAQGLINGKNHVSNMQKVKTWLGKAKRFVFGK